MRKKKVQEEVFDDQILDDLVDDQEKPFENPTWISLGNRQFHIEDVQSIYIQKNHLIINFDYKYEQMVIYFGSKGYDAAKTVFDQLAHMFKAYVIKIPLDAIPDPDIWKTAYGDELSKRVQDAEHMQNEKCKLRYQKKLKKCLEEIAQLKKKMSE